MVPCFPFSILFWPTSLPLLKDVLFYCHWVFIFCFIKHEFSHNSFVFLYRFSSIIPVSDIFNLSFLLILVLVHISHQSTFGIVRFFLFYRSWPVSFIIFLFRSINPPCQHFLLMCLNWLLVSHWRSSFVVCSGFFVLV